MPSRTRRNYRGGALLENCQKWVKNSKNGLPPEKENDCNFMIKNGVNFKPPSMFFSSTPMNGATPLKTLADWNAAYAEFKRDEKREADLNAKIAAQSIPRASSMPTTSGALPSYWPKCNMKDVDGKFKVTRPGKGPSSDCIPPQESRQPALVQQAPVKQLPLCTNYDRVGANVYKNGVEMSTECDSSNLPSCSKWVKALDGNWGVVGMKDGRESFCNVNGLPVDTNNVIRNKLQAIEGTREEAIQIANSDLATYPWVKPENKGKTGNPYNITNKEVGRYNPFYGGKRSRRRTRKSRR